MWQKREMSLEQSHVGEKGNDFLSNNVKEKRRVHTFLLCIMHLNWFFKVNKIQIQSKMILLEKYGHLCRKYPCLYPDHTHTKKNILNMNF